MSTAITHNQITLTTGITPSAPPANEAALYAGSDNKMRQIDDAGNIRNIYPLINFQDEQTDYGDQRIIRVPYGTKYDDGAGYTRLMVVPRMAQRRWSIWFPYSDTVGVNGNEALTATSGGAAVVSEFKNKHFTNRYTTTTTSANAAGLTKPLAEVRGVYFPYMSTIIHTASSMVGQRIWVGLFSLVPSNIDLVNNTTSLAAFNYTYTDGNWYAYTRDASTNTRTLIAAGSTDTSYRLELWYSNATYYFRMNDLPVISISTTLPSTTVNLKPYIYVIGNGSASVLNISRIYLEQN
jgi:hypothetical protein